MGKNAEIKILIATHKKYWMPSDEIYLPIHVGKQNKKSIGYIGDETGENISHKNQDYCELTALYWGWKNLKADYIGLAHYRRHFSIKQTVLGKENKKRAVLTKEELRNILKSTDIILPEKRNYYIETNSTHYKHAHQAKWLDETEKIIQESYPQYQEAFQCVSDRSWAHMFNMMIMKKEQIDSYCSWLFAILAELEKRVACSKQPAEPRLYGYISELLLDVWIEANQLSYKEINFLFIEPQNWLKKGGLFLYRKFFK